MLFAITFARMKKYLLITFSIVSLFGSINSCKQCNPVAPVTVKKDSVSITKLDELNAEIKKDSLNPFLYYKRAQLYEANNDFKSAATDMYLAMTLDSLRPEFYLYSAELFKRSGEPQRGI